MSKPTLYIVAGANGSGKTTFALQFTQKNNLFFINADELAKAINPTDLTQVRIQAGREFFHHLEHHLKSGKSFTIESTLSGTYLIKIIEKAKTLGFQIHIIYLYLDTPQLNIARVKTRVKSGGHDVPEEDIKRRFYRSRKLFWNTYRERCDKWELFYNANENFQIIAVGTKVNNNKIVMDQELMNRFLEGVANV